MRVGYHDFMSLGYGVQVWFRKMSGFAWIAIAISCVTFELCGHGVHEGSVFPVARRVHAVSHSTSRGCSVRCCIGMSPSRAIAGYVRKRTGGGGVQEVLDGS